MTEDEVDRAVSRARADSILCLHYLRFIRKFRRKPQLIRVAPDVIKHLITTAERRPITFFGVDVVIDETLTNTCICQWRN